MYKYSKKKKGTARIIKKTFLLNGMRMNYKKLSVALCIGLLMTGCQKQDKEENAIENDVEINESIDENVDSNNEIEDIDSDSNGENTNGKEENAVMDFPQIEIVFNGEKLKMPISLDEFGDRMSLEKDKDGKYRDRGDIEIDDRTYKYGSMKINNSAYIVNEFDMTNKRMNIDLPFGINLKEDSVDEIKEKIPFENKVLPYPGCFVYDDVIVKLSIDEDGKVFNVEFLPLSQDSIDEFNEFMDKTHGEIKGDTELVVDGNEIKNPLYYEHFDGFKKAPLDENSEEFKKLLDFFIRTDKRQSLDDEELAKRNTEYLLDNFEELDYYGTKLILRKDVPQGEGEQSLAFKDRYLEIIFPSDLDFSLKNKYIDINNSNWDLDTLEEILEDEDMKYTKSKKGSEDTLIFNLDKYTQIVYSEDYVSIVKNFTRDGLMDWDEEYKEIRRTVKQ